MARRRKFSFKLKLKPETVYSIFGVSFMTLGVLVLVSFSGQGILLSRLNAGLMAALGLSLLFLPFLFIAAGLMFFRSKAEFTKPNVLLGGVITMLGVLGLFQTGYVGEKTFINASVLLSSYGALAVFAALVLIGFFLISQLTLQELFEFLSWFKRPAKSTDQAELATATQSSGGWHLPKLKLPFGQKNTAGQRFLINAGDRDMVDDQDVIAPVAIAGSKPDPTQPQTQASAGSGPILTPALRPRAWEYPPLTLLSESEGGEADRGDVSKNADLIEATLESFGIRAKVKEVNYGPSVTQYALDITRGTKLSKITGLSTDLALALAAPTGQIRIEAPMPGRALVGIEVPNHSAKYVTLKKLLSFKQMKEHQSKLAVALGIDVSNNPVILDIARMPHILIAGATGSGKSVAINSFLCSMLFRASPDEVKFILVDPKRVELTGYNDIPHLLVPVIVEPKKVVSALKWATSEMDQRYQRLAEVGVRNIEGYNELAGHTAMPNIVIVIDELADIMLYAPAEVEEAVTRIAQMARAVGIHLLLATQRPSVDVLTGLIKANIPARIAFNVSSMMDSRVILDTPGAEKLLGRGDMLFIPPDKAKPVRVQGTFVSDPEIKRLIEFIKSQGQQPEYQEEITTKYKAIGGGRGSSGAFDSGEGSEGQDELFLEVAKFIVTTDKASSSMIQRRFSVGYNRAARILDQLYAAGLVGPADGSKPRSVNATRIMEYIHASEGEVETG